MLMLNRYQYLLVIALTCGFTKRSIVKTNERSYTALGCKNAHLQFRNFVFKNYSPAYPAGTDQGISRQLL